MMICKRSSGLVISVVFAGLLLGLAGCETASMMRAKGVDQLRQGDLVQANRQFARAARAEPGDYRSQFYLGLTYLKLGEPLKAQLALERALTLRPERTAHVDNALDLLAKALYQQHRYDALHAFLAKTATYYGQTDDYLRQAEYLVKTNDLDQAKTAFRKAAFFADRGDVTPYLAIADFYTSINDVPNALAALQYAWYVDPGNEQAGNGLRRFGVVPGPTIAVEPPKPEVLE